ncbi:hypothetical protein NITGR_1060004 [Nitrospina gracilis 3/211]|uniref:Uncharacterized protein n=2 Tax=Nitrospinaceae TaxID=407032 RepID=M1YV54_NITG3|nr:hypothetical protein NITGR_1060004 [Nitrospina gracilis 3/211]
MGGGPTGVEYSGARGEGVRLVMVKDYAELQRDRIRILLFEAGGSLLGGFCDDATDIARTGQLMVNGFIGWLLWLGVYIFFSDRDPQPPVGTVVLGMELRVLRPPGGHRHPPDPAESTPPAHTAQAGTKYFGPNPALRSRGLSSNLERNRTIRAAC